MKVKHQFGTTWAMEPTALKQLLNAVVEAEFDDVDVIVDSDSEWEPTYRVEDGVAFLGVTGSLVAKPSWFTRFLGMTTYEELSQGLTDIRLNPDIRSVKLEIDSPGGEVSGIREVVQAIHDLGKPVVASVTGMAASAAYWIASAADSIEAGDTSLIGCLGTQMTMYLDDDEDVIRFTSSLTPGKNPDPASSAGKDQYQQIVDDLSDIFLGDVAKNRGLPSAETVAEKYGAGATVVARRALDMGMIDRIVGPGMDNETKASYTGAEPPDENRSPVMADRDTKTQSKPEARAAEAPAAVDDGAVAAQLQADNDLLRAAQTDLQAELLEAKTRIEALSAELKEHREEAAAAAEAGRVEKRERILTDAMTAGKITPATVAEWRKNYDKDAAMVVRLLALVPNGSAMPVAPAGIDSGIQEAPEDDPETRDRAVAARAAKICQETGAPWANAVAQANKEIG